MTEKEKNKDSLTCRNCANRIDFSTTSSACEANTPWVKKIKPDDKACKYFRRKESKMAIKFWLEANKTDEDMLELYTKDKKGSKILWGVVNADFVYISGNRDRDFYYRLTKENEAIEFNLEEVEKQ